MPLEVEEPPFVDEHRIRIREPRERVWPVLRAYADTLATARHHLLAPVLGTDPASGFVVDQEVPGSLVCLSGRHRFSVYRLAFELAGTEDGSTLLSARTRAAFPGAAGRAYRALVIGSGGHAVAVRWMLVVIRRAVATEQQR